MTLDRRLAKLEGSLTPTQTVLAWLAEAHEYPSLPQYVASLLDAPREAYPLVRFGSQVEAAVRGSIRGKSDDVWKAVRGAVGHAFFLFELVIRLNLAAEETLRYENLRWALLRQWMRSLSLEAELTQQTRRRRSERPDGPSMTNGRLLAHVPRGLAHDLYTEEQARTRLEGRYLDGRRVLFAGLAREWAELRERLKGLAALADQLPELRGSGAAVLALDELRARASKGAPARATELVEVAKAATFDMLGEPEWAAALVERRLRPAIEPPSTPTL